MKTWFGFFLLLLIVIFMTACEESKDTAVIEFSNLSDFEAAIDIYNKDYIPISVTIQPKSTLEVAIEDGEAGLDIYNGRAIIDYTYICAGQPAPESYQTHADLSVDNPAFIQIDNTYGCMLMRNFSTHELGDMWININFGVSEIIPPWTDLAKFYDPYPYEYITKNVRCNGFTMFGAEVNVDVWSDDLTIVDLEPDAACVWVENNSSSNSIYEVYIEPSVEAGWGNDELDGILAPGESMAWTCEANISWDIMISDLYYDYILTNQVMKIDEFLVLEYEDDYSAYSSSDPERVKAENSMNHEKREGNFRLRKIPQEFIDLSAMR